MSQVGPVYHKLDPPAASIKINLYKATKPCNLLVNFAKNHPTLKSNQVFSIPECKCAYDWLLNHTIGLCKKKKAKRLLGLFTKCEGVKV